METFQQTIRYVGAHAYQFGRRVFRSESGALTLEWVIIAALLLAAATGAGIIFSTAVSNESKTIK